MAEWDPLVNEIFVRAIEAGSASERAEVLDRMCGGDVELRRKVEALLLVHDGAGSFLEHPAPGLASPRSVATGEGATEPSRPSARSSVRIDEKTEPFGSSSGSSGNQVARPLTEGPGTRIGPYKLLEQIGEGGMGVVYMTEQEAPVRRKVALKIIKPGMDTGQVVARFEAERQALALMDHPNIAKVFDGGATATGRPFFVMELVNGIPITDYCDEARLGPRERLELFVPVCRAIQHAHQKGVIHRDVKPSNVLVTLVDGRPTPKVIDFGIAKATDQRLTEKTLFTQFGAIVGTLEYMSPEQAELSSQDVDTRSDVFSLGVLLYELLTGSTPLDRARLREAGYEEILRRIREEEPSRPSTRLSDSGEALPTIAARRHTEPAKLTKLVRGELDWIVMKAIEKDRTRRYESASGFAQDVERYLADAGVEACPPSRWYWLRKFARKNRGALATAAAFAALLLAASAVSGYLALRARSAERLAKSRLAEAERSRDQARAVGEFMVAAFREPDPDKNRRDLKVVDLLAAAEARLGPEFAGPPAIHGVLLKALGETYRGLGLPSRAIDVTSRAVALLERVLGPDHRDAVDALTTLGAAYFEAGRTAESISSFEEALKHSTALLDPDHAVTLRARSGLARSYSSVGRSAEAIALQNETVRMGAAKLGPHDPVLLSFRSSLAEYFRQAGRSAEAVTALEELMNTYTATSGPEHRETMMVRNNLAAAYQQVGRTEDAIPLQEMILEKWMADFGPDHLRTLTAANNLADSYRRVGRTADAIAMQEKNLSRLMATVGAEHRDTVASRNNLAAAYQDAGRRDEAIVLLREVVPAAAKIIGPGHPNTIRSTNRLGGLYEQAGRWADAESLYLESLAVFEAKQPDHWGTFQARSLWGACLVGLKQFDKAEPMIVSGYEGMKSRESSIPPPDRPRLGEAAARVVRLYEAWGKPEKAQEWRRKSGPEGPPAGPTRR